MSCQVEAQSKLPVLDFTDENLRPGTSSWLSASKDVRDALEQHGAFLVVDKKLISSELSNEVFRLLEELFDLPKGTKVKNRADVSALGYNSGTAEAPIFESLGIPDGASSEGIQRFTTLMWPSGNDHFCEIMHSYSKQVLKLHQMVTKMVFESYGVEKYYDSHVNSSIYVLRPTKYRVPEMDESNVGSQAHTDSAFLNVLQQNHVPGLEIKLKDGNWISVDFPASSFIFLAGEPLQAWFNDRIQPPLHRVIMNGKETRYSMLLGSFIKGTIETPEELVDDKHPLKFIPMDHMEYIRFRAKNSNLPPEERLKAYCGI